MADGFGVRLRRIRTDQGLRQSDLAGPGISASYISMLETDKREPTPQVVMALAQRLNVSESALIPVEDGADLPIEIRRRLASAEMALRHGDAAFARTTFTELLPLAGLEAAWGLARAEEAIGQLEVALLVYAQVENSARISKDGLRAVRASIAMARCLAQTGDEFRAIGILDGALLTIDEFGLTGSDEHVQAVSALMGAHYSANQFGEATRIAKSLLTMVDDGGSWKARGSAYWNAAGVAEAAGDVVLATKYAERAVALMSEGDDERALARCSVACAWFWLRHPDGSQQLDRIELLLKNAHGWLERCGTVLDLGYAETELARVALLRGDSASALRWARLASDRFGREPRSQAPDTLLVTAEAQMLGGDSTGARITADALEMTLKGLPHTREISMAWRGLADLLKRLGDPESAYRALEGALQANNVDSAPSPGQFVSVLRTVAAETSSVRS